MAEPHVVTALIVKRAEISGEIRELEKQLARQRASLVNLDATIKLFSPRSDPDAIPPKRPYRRTLYFARNELSRLMFGAFRIAIGPLTVGEIVAAVMQAKALPLDDPDLRDIVVDRILVVLRRSLRRGIVTKTGTLSNARWTIER